MAKICSRACSECNAHSSLCDRAKAEVFYKSNEIEISENVAVSFVNRLRDLWCLAGILQDLLHFLHQHLVASGADIFRRLDVSTWKDLRSVCRDQSTKVFGEYVHAV